MVLFFKKGARRVTAVEVDHVLTDTEKEKLTWLFDGARPLSAKSVKGTFIGPRREMITPWSTNAVEITQNMGLQGITRIEEYELSRDAEPRYDKMLQRVYDGLNQKIFDVNREAEPVEHIADIREYNRREGLALSADEENYLAALSERLGRPLTDSEVFGFSQVNSEHCRHKIFNGTFIIDGKEMPSSLFGMIKKTSKENPGRLVSAYKDNVAFVKGPVVDQFYPENPDKADYFTSRPVETVLSLKAETHNFPTTVEPFNGAATGSGGEIRDRLGGGKASLPLAGTAVYMTSYPRLDPRRRWELMMDPRVWLYQTPADILIKASNGASDFGNKFGQPLICGSLLTFEHNEEGRVYAYDKVIMLAGGVGYAFAKDAIKGVPEPGQAVVLMGGDNYRIGMGGGAVSSVATGQYDNAIELNAVQRANPEMQKRVSNVIRAMAESENNPIVSIHDHGAGGHLNALSELVEETGGHIDISALPVGDPTLSAKEIIGNESQERMGMVMKNEDVDFVRRVADRERSPMYVIGETTGDHRFVFELPDGSKPMNLEMSDMFGNPPKTVMRDVTVERSYADCETEESRLEEYLNDVLSLEAVACKDWLTNKVDRSITGKIARQQCQGELQLPLSDCGVVALDYNGKKGIATSIGHAPQAALADSGVGSVLAIAEALTNIVGAPLDGGLSAVSLSANWMWPCRNEGEDAALYRAVKACSDFACALGINIPTGKDSLSMTQKYGDDKVMAPGTVIISAAGEVKDVRKTVSPVLQNKKSTLYYIDFSRSPLALGGSALAQTLGRVGSHVPTVSDPDYFARAFNAVQALVSRGALLAAHDVSAGGLVTTLLEMAFANTAGGIDINLDSFDLDVITTLFAENPALVVQVAEPKRAAFERTLADAGVDFKAIGTPAKERLLTVGKGDRMWMLGIDHLRDVVIVDTAGRLHVDDEMMEEAEAIKRAVKPDQVLMVVDAMTGQDVVNVAAAFAERVDFDGVIMSKMDGDARGGGALSIKQVTGKPIKFISAGEKPDSLEEFHPDRIAKRILGMGDMVSLIESAVRVQQEAEEAETAKRLAKSQLTLNDFVDMNRQIRKMGGVRKLVSALPGGDKALGSGQVDEGALAHMEVIINSMTKAERKKPDLLNGSRRARIAAGAGVSVTEVNQLMKQFNETKKMMKKMMPSVDELSGKKGKKGKRRRRIPGMPGGMSMADIKKVQAMLEQGDK